MRQFLGALDDRLTPAETLFFTWLIRVIAAGTLVGSAWIDDAPPLELAAFAIALYVFVRVIAQFGALCDAAPFSNRALKAIFALGAIGTLALSFMTVVTFVEQLSLLATN